MQIKVIPLSKPFLPTLAQYIGEKHNQLFPDLSELVFVFPSQRNKYYFRHYLLQSWKKEGFIPPQMLTIKELYYLLFERMGGGSAKVISGLERNVILKMITSSLKHKYLSDLPFLSFISIGEKLLKLFDELTAEDVSIEEVEEKRQQLHFPEKYIEEELPILQEIYNQYLNKISQEGLIDDALLAKKVGENFKPEYLAEKSYIYFAGLLALRGRDFSLMEKILGSLPSELVLHSPKDKLVEKGVESDFYHHHRILERFQVKPEGVEIISPVTKSSSGKPIFIQKCTNQLDEVSYILRTLAEVLPRFLPHRIAVVLPDESLSLPLMDALEKYHLPHNLSLGLPLKFSPIYSLLKLLYECGESNYHYKEFLSLLKHPLIKGGVREGVVFRPLVYDLERVMKETNASYFSQKFKNKENKSLREFLETIFATVKKDVSFSEYVENLKIKVGEVIRLNPEVSGYYSLSINQFLDKLGEMKQWYLPEEIFKKPLDKLSLIIKVMETLTFPSFGDFLEGVQIIGVLEARNLDFDCLILPSLNEGIFPKKSEKDLFIPAALREEVGLPFYKERESLFYYYFAELMSDKKEVYISYREEEEEINIRSRFIDKLLGEKNTARQIQYREKKETYNYIFPSTSGAEAEPPKEVKKDSQLLERLEKMQFSPSALKNYCLCSYKFYLSSILKLREPKVVEEEYHPRIWGEIIHSSLKNLYCQEGIKEFKEMGKEKIREKLIPILDQEFKKAYPYPKPSLLIELELYRQRVQSIMDMDVRRFQEGFQVWRLEEKLIPCSFSISKRVKVSLTGRVDRIDKKKGKYYFIDYKVGGKPATKSYRVGEDFREFQLPLYALIFCQGDFSLVGGLIYYHLQAGRDKFTSLDILEKEGSDYLLQFREEILTPTLEEILTPDKPFRCTEDLQRCRYCPYIDFCRRRV